MEKKESIEKVLGAKVSDQNMADIKTYYKAFYENPEEYAGDALVELILQDLGIESTKAPVGNVLNIVNTIPGMDIRHIDKEETLAWGTYNNAPVYVVIAEDVHVRNLMESCGKSIPTDGLNPTEPVVVVMHSDVNDTAIVIVMDKEVEADIPVIHGFTKVCTRPMFLSNDIDELAEYYVPFVPSGNGRNPVMWISHRGHAIEGAEPVFLNEKFEYYQDLDVGTDEDHIKKVYEQLKTYYPGVDLDTEADDRYAAMRISLNTVIYNRNHLAFNGNVPSTKALLPAVISIVRGTEDVKSTVYDAVHTDNWHQVFYVKMNEGEETKETKSPANGMPSTPGMSYEGRQLGQSQATTRLGKLMDNATGSYEQVDVNK